MARQPSDWVDRRALDRHGAVMGLVVDDYVDPETRQVRWLAVATGYFGTRVAVVPVRGASLLGSDVVIAHDRDIIARAPAVNNRRRDRLGRRAVPDRSLHRPTPVNSADTERDTLT